MSEIQTSQQGSSDNVEVEKEVASDVSQHENAPVYKLYKRRFVGLVALFLLNVASSMAWAWFGPIASDTAKDFGISLDQVNWLGNIVCVVYVPSIILVPWIISSYGVQRCCWISAILLLLSAWIRYAGTIKSLPSSGAYALLIIGQLFSAISQAVYQILAPKYSEAWFGLKGRTTATMIIGISNPIGAALGQLISPLITGTRTSVLVLGIIASAAVPLALLIGNEPPTPPTYTASQPSPSITELLRELMGKPPSKETTITIAMTRRERFDFALVVILFTMFFAVVNTFSILSAQWLEPYGYTDENSGLMGAALILAGIVAAFITAPLFDRVFTNHLALSVKIIIPLLAAIWLGMIWAIRPNNTAVLFVLFALIGIGSITLLPVALELSVELTRAADASSAILWGMGNLLTVIFILVESALRAPSTGNPPLNMHKAFIFQACFLCVSVLAVIPLKGEQTRRHRDEMEMRNAVSDSGAAAEQGQV